MTSALKKADELFEAIQRNNFRLTRQLLKAGANPNRLLLNGVTPFHLAVAASSTSSYEYVDLILQHRGDPNVRDTEGLTPLHIAAQWGKADCLQLLLQCGGDPAIKEREGRDAYWFAKENTNCKFILEEYNNSANTSFNFKLQQVNPEKLKEELQCSNCGKVKRDVLLNFNNNITLRTKKSSSSDSDSTEVISPSNQEETRQEIEVSYLQVEPREEKTSKESLVNPLHEASYHLKKPLESPASNDRIYLDPSGGSFNTGLDATSPDNCYLFVRPRKRSSSKATLDKTVSVLSPRSPLASPVNKDPNLRLQKSSGIVKSPCAKDLPSQQGQLLKDIKKSSSFKMPPINRSPNSIIISPQQCRRMLRSTKDNIIFSKGAAPPTSTLCQERTNTKDTPSPSRSVKNLSVVKPNIVDSSSFTRCDDSSFTFAESTVPLECSSEQPDIAAIPETGKPQCSVTVQNTHKDQIKTHDRNKTTENIVCGDAKHQHSNARQKLQSTCHEDFSDVFPESLDVSQISTGDEVFIYSDSDGSTLIEQRCVPPKSSGPRSMDEILSPPIKLSVSLDATVTSVSDSTLIYDWKSLLEDDEVVVSGCKYEPSDNEAIVIPNHIQQLTDDEIRKKLLGYGQKPGPISCARNLYKKRLHLLERGFHLQQRQNKDAIFSHEMRNLLLGKPLPDSVIDDDHIVRKEFDNPSTDAVWRGGTTKDSFNYLLLDPRVTCKLPNRAKYLSETDCLKVFAGAVFYVGKGKKSRPYAHFKEALSKKVNNRKIQHIHDIWSSNCGVISLHVFQNVMACEAFTREAAMIEALGLGHLTNSMRGKCYGIAADWNAPRLRRYGTFLVLKSMQILLLEGERQIRSNQVSGRKRKT